jgi:hypothetical protein
MHRLKAHKQLSALRAASRLAWPSMPPTAPLNRLSVPRNLFNPDSPEFIRLGEVMVTDIKLDQGDGNWVTVEGTVLKTTAADLMLDSPQRRLPGGSPHRRALVHNTQDGLTINFNGDYRGGVTVVGNLVVTSDILVGSITSVSGAISALQGALAALEDRVAQLTDFVGAVVIPNWRTKTEVESGDDMGIVSPSAEELGLIVEYQNDQRNPHFQHEDVISITPPAGTLVSRGGTVTVLINLDG